jgi:hypothetical protein
MTDPIEKDIIKYTYAVSHGGGNITVNGRGAATWTTNHDGIGEDDKGYAACSEVLGCADYTSRALQEGGGLPISDSWNPDLGCTNTTNAWYSTDEQYQYLLSLGYKPLYLPIMPKDASTMMSPADIQKWFETNKVPPGSLVYYNTGNAESRFTHVAMTTSGTSSANGITTPSIEDYNMGVDGPHSILTNTYTKNLSAAPTALQIYTIVILVKPN